MKNTQWLIGLLLLTGSVAYAQLPSDAPAGTTGLCKDGTYYSGPTKSGACRGHKGVRDWYAAMPAAATASAPATMAAPANPPAPPAAPPAPPAPVAAAPSKAPMAPAAPVAPAAKPASSSAYTPPATSAPGGGPGLVWVNTSSKVYHCQGDRWYGKTKLGHYLSEADAKAQGNRPDHGKPCS